MRGGREGGRREEGEAMEKKASALNLCVYSLPPEAGQLGKGNRRKAGMHV